MVVYLRFAVESLSLSLSSSFLWFLLCFVLVLVLVIYNCECINSGQRHKFDSDWVEPLVSASSKPELCLPGSQSVWLMLNYLSVAALVKVKKKKDSSF